MTIFLNIWKQPSYEKQVTGTEFGSQNMVAGTKCGLYKWVLEQNLDFKYWYQNRIHIVFRYPYLKPTFCSGTNFWSPHFVLVTIFWEPNSVPVTCFWEGGCLQIFKKIWFCYDKISLFRLFTYLAVTGGQTGYNTSI